MHAFPRFVRRCVRGRRRLLRGLVGRARLSRVRDATLAPTRSHSAGLHDRGPHLASRRIWCRCRAEGGGHPGRAPGGVDAAWRGDGHRPRPPSPSACRLPGRRCHRGRPRRSLRYVSRSEIGLHEVEGDVAVFGPGNTEAIAQLRAGDAVRIDNSGYLAAQTYHRHQVPNRGSTPCGTGSRHTDGSPRYPQRPLLLGPLALRRQRDRAGGRFEGKIVVVESLLDREGVPWQAGTTTRCASISARRSTGSSACDLRTMPSTEAMRRRRTQPTRSAISACSIRRCVISAAGSRRGWRRHRLRGSTWWTGRLRCHPTHGTTAVSNPWSR